VDAPVSGGVRRAVDGSLAVMVGGEAATIASIRPLLDCMGRSIFVTGGIGTGHAMKALNNYVSAAGLLAACEALQVGARFGLDPALMTDILNASTGRNKLDRGQAEAVRDPEDLCLRLLDRADGQGPAHRRRSRPPSRRAGGFSQVCADLWAEAEQALGPQADQTAIDAFLAGPDKPRA
jgi:3-hydroxyisobutyrate dehydrogenase